ncbi:Neural-cadherin [Armadillidium vulgare]|nr:Neural-cadherin [Armadillidium vulgare]
MGRQISVHGGMQKLGYVVDKNSNPDRIFGADSNGMIRLQKPLDRERSQSHRLVILAMDQGNPVKTANATLERIKSICLNNIDVVDINDNPPYFTCPTLVKINEGSPPKVIANLTLDDPDDWKKGHGPPFSLSLDPKAPSYIKKAVKVDFDKVLGIFCILLFMYITLNIVLLIGAFS